MSTLRTTRQASYRFARTLGDVQAIASGSPSKIAKRYANKVLGRHVVRRLWF